MTTAATPTVAPAGKTIKIDIVSDTVCPWCYVGKKRLEKAITAFKSTPEHKDVQFQIDWHPYQLDPSASKVPIKKMDMYASKFGAARAPLIRDRMIQVGQEEGINFSYNGSVVNTLDSHRLINYATARGKQDEIVEELFRNYFEEDKFLASQEGVQEVRDEIQRAKVEGVQGVPNIMIDNKYVLSGAQEPDTFIDVFNRVAK
ncbi:hypothetical protein BGZ95_001632 [Linnemannia exigua]|uniref:DSBA-like thioredoxin domain-containing protein n=1 Tax=Linnemannia exigua TaxID=604196 RepID=A0AAD4D6M4_9FUNG|nr:hypothetical protein BGZ95_001632 [Linnemannia exigua]